MLYFLWDLGLKVGQSSRTPDEMVRMAKDDLTIRTALLEARYVWGDEALYEEARRRFYGEVVQGSEREYVSGKLAERDARHNSVDGEYARLLHTRNVECAAQCVCRGHPDLILWVRLALSDCFRQCGSHVRR